ncbi:hypothetical protein pEaSNUABM34_00067 [Erwinia phage pEa_SNUABM_34]|nr:hypothetical protein pEaSNUABM34_00067 [Erwinia phage pEa_SNUABM_34]
MLPFAPRTLVVSMRNGNKEFDVRIDRESMWGNKFYMKNESKEERARVIYEYGVWLWTKIYNGDITLSQLDALYGKRLGCWCSPKPCHGDELRKAVEWAHATICKWERISRTYARRKKHGHRQTKKRKSDDSGRAFKKAA